MPNSEQSNQLNSPDTEARDNARCTIIRRLNDDFRKTRIGGHLMITSEVRALGAQAAGIILSEISAQSEFERSNDPYCEHDFGGMHYLGQHVFWKIDYYDERLEFGSPDPSDPSVTTRVMTIMLASEY